MDRNIMFYAVFDYDDDPISIYFPDLPGCFSCGRSTEEAMTMAKEALDLYLEDMKEDEIPRANPYEEIKAKGLNQRIFPIKTSRKR